MNARKPGGGFAAASLALWLGVTVGATALAQQFQPPRDFSDMPQAPLSTSRLIVGLGEELAGRVDAAAQQGLEAARVVAAEALSTIAGVALQTEQIASGGNVVLGIDVPNILARLGSELGGLDGVKAVYRLYPLSGGDPGRLDMLLELEPSAAEGVAEAIRARGMGEIEFFGDDRQRGKLGINLSAMLEQAQSQLEAAPAIRFVEREYLLQPH